MRKSFLSCFFSFILITVFIGSGSLVALADEVKLEIRNLEEGKVAIEAFTLREKLPLKIEAIGQEGNEPEEYRAYAWILDAASRRLVWDFNSKTARQKHKRDGLLVQDEITLPAGDYELNFAAVSAPIRVKNFLGAVSEFWSQLKSDDEEISSRWGVKILCERSKADCSVLEATQLRRDSQAIVQLIENGNEAYQTEGFSLSREMDVKIYAIGEGYPNKREMFDYAWIVDANSRKRVWEMDPRNTDHAGGGEKNRRVEDIVTLPAGDYLVSYVTDDSHSFDEWNTMPPTDPRYWGITIWGAGVGEGETYVKPYRAEPSRSPIVELTRVPDDANESQRFQLTKPTRLRIYALGESSSQRTLADYGWIMDARTREKVWEMKYRDTEHAGGGQKNRMCDTVIELPAGSYIAYYVTDDSHAFGDWNVGPPFDPESWGLTIWGAGDDFDSSSVRNLQADEDPDIIAQIIRVGDDEKIRKQFTLTQKIQVRIYALGEGDRSEMYDYGWIETERGDVIWEMSFNQTESAGGASKNRRVNQLLTLDPGTYFLCYQSDDSHSYAEWNQTPPEDPLYWGITLTRE